VLYGIDLTAWGWFWLRIGLAQMLTIDFLVLFGLVTQSDESLV
jgi:hypothetical protein